MSIIHNYAIINREKTQTLKIFMLLVPNALTFKNVFIT